MLPSPVVSSPRALALVSDPEQATDAVLVRQAQTGNSDAFGELVRRHQRRAFAVARSITLSTEDAEDAVQEGFLHAFRALDRVRPELPFGPWLYRVIANAALSLVRRRTVRETSELSPLVGTLAPDPAIASELRARLRAALAELPARQRAVVVLHDVEGFKHGEIARMLEIAEGTSRADLHAARQLLRRQLAVLRETGS